MKKATLSFVIQSTFYIFNSEKIIVLMICMMGTKAFRVVSSMSMALTLTVAALSIFGITITGFYPGIVVLLLVAMIPIASKHYAKKIRSKSSDYQRNYYKILTFINLLSILVVIWMMFVILIDRVFPIIL